MCDIIFLDQIVKAQVKKNNEDLSYFKCEIKRLLKELDAAKKIVNVFQDSKSKHEEELERMKAEHEVQEEQNKLNIENLKKENEDKIEILKIEKEMEIEGLKKLKEEEIKTLKKQSELEIEALEKQMKLEIETLQKQKEEQININTENFFKIEDLKKQKAELEDTKNSLEKELREMKIELQNEHNSGKEQLQKAQTTIMDCFKRIGKLQTVVNNCKCNSNKDDISALSCNYSDESLNRMVSTNELSCYIIKM